ILLQHVSIVPCLCVFGISHFGLYYLYSSTTITKNKSQSSGGGVYYKSGTFEMSGGAITDNETKEYGGGVCNEDGTFEMSGGEMVLCQDLVQVKMRNFFPF
ncbi:hypothetical protein, partial [Roseburia inulinivorans]|uniref:hypothetical protein n=1 Tax=Roseburia inulinivorans TaxID=360807 RepID=UPI000AE2B99C